MISRKLAVSKQLAPQKANSQPVKKVEEKKSALESEISQENNKLSHMKNQLKEQMPKNLIKRAEYKVVKFKKVKDEIDDAISILLEQL